MTAYRFTPNEKGVEVSNGDGRLYQVYVKDGVPTFCTCPSFKFQHGEAKDRVPCKHMLSVYALIGGREEAKEQAKQAGEETITTVVDGVEYTISGSPGALDLVRQMFEAK